MSWEKSEAMEIVPGDLDDPRIVALLDTHFRAMRSTAPVESCHVLPIDAMRVPELSFWAAWNGDALLGVGGLYELSPEHGEIKSMHTAQAGRRRGVGMAMLNHIMQTTRARGMKRLSLETGAMDFFVPARTLYEQAGFSYCPPFGDYVEDPNSVFMTRTL
jgi:putative acetyltransferase